MINARFVQSIIECMNFLAIHLLVVIQSLQTVLNMEYVSSMKILVFLNVNATKHNKVILASNAKIMLIKIEISRKTVSAKVIAMNLLIRSAI